MELKKFEADSIVQQSTLPLVQPSSYGEEG
jgi:hypothetical protein